MDPRSRLRAFGALALATTMVAGSGAAFAQSPAASPAVDASPVASPAVSAEPLPTMSPECAFDQLQTKTEGRLVIGADNPAYPPWFGGTPPEGSEWQISDPYSREGFESAIAYAVAEQLGFAPELVDWKYVGFVKSFAPGDKAFDMYLTQVTIKNKRARAVDFSDPYYTFNQSIVALSDNPIVGVTTVEGLKEFKLGAQVGTTSLDVINEVVVPTQEPRVYPDNDKALRGLKNGAIDGLVVDLPTAFYMRDVQLGLAEPPVAATIVGQFPVIGEPERLGIVLQKDSPLTACVNQALAVMTANGTWQAIYDRYLGAIAATPIPMFTIGVVPSPVPSAEAPASPAASASAAP
jgi:polar amino acid transport system substrate-binding protein